MSEPTDKKNMWPGTVREPVTTAVFTTAVPQKPARVFFLLWCLAFGLTRANGFGTTMAGPRSLSRSTKVAAPAASRKGKGKHHKKRAALATWDHDNSSADESVDKEPASSASSAAAPAGKKRPRVGASKAARAGALGQDGGKDGTQKLSGGRSKRPRAGAEGDKEESGSGSDGEDDIGEGGQGGGNDEGDAGGAAAAPTGGMGDVMARILGQKLDARVQVGGGHCCSKKQKNVSLVQ